jgi:outer membrane protein assembly factor BamB
MTRKPENSRFSVVFIACIAFLHSPLSAQPDPGHRRWFFFIEQTYVQSPAVGSRGTIYIGTGLYNASRPSDGVYAVHPDGTQKWKVTFGKTVHSSIALDTHENLYFIMGDVNDPNPMNAALVSLDSSGIIRWRFEAVGWMAPDPNTGFTPAVASDGTVYAVGRYSLFAVDSGGALKWKYDFPLKDHTHSSGTLETTGIQMSAPAVAKDGTIYVNTERGGLGRTQVDGGLFAFDSDGNLKWRLYDVGGCAAPVIGEDGTVYSAIGRYENFADTADWPRAAEEAKLLAVRPDGTLEWSVTTRLWAEASPSIGPDGTLYLGTTHHPLNKPGWFYAITPDGRIRWKYDTYDDVKDNPSAQKNAPDIYNSPAVDSNGLIYFGNELGLFYAMTPDGKVEWMENVSSLMFGSPALADDGTLYVATHGVIDSEHFALIAMNTGSRGLAKSPWPKFRQNNANTGNAGHAGPPESVRRAAGPGTVELHANYPNPFNPSTRIEYSLAAPGFVSLVIFDLEGRRIRELVHGRGEAGLRRVLWDGTDERGRRVPSGVYFCRVRMGSGGKVYNRSRKLCMVR